MQDRLVSLDVFRGMTIAGMVLVNNPGTWAHIYDPLEHAAWHGLTPTDWIFPFFLFIVGVAIPIALRKHTGRDASVNERASEGRPPAGGRGGAGRPPRAGARAGGRGPPRRGARRRGGGGAPGGGGRGVNGRAPAVRTGSGSDRGISDQPGKTNIYRKILTRSVIIFLLGLAISVTPFFQFQASDAPDPLKMLVWLVMTAGLFYLLLRKFRVAAVLIAASILGIIALNLAGYNLVTYNFATMRIPGVLQRIAVCYLIVSILFLHTTWKQQLGIAAALLLGYWALMTLVPVPGCEITTINDKACNLAAWLDRTILTENHIWRSARVFDPEGILSTLPAIATTISGVLTGTWLMRSDEGQGTSDKRRTLSEIVRVTPEDLHPQSGEVEARGTDHVTSNEENSPPYEGWVAAVSADGVVLSEYSSLDPEESHKGQVARDKENSPPYEGWVAAVSADEVVLSEYSSLVTRHSSLNRVSGMFFFGTILLAAGYIWHSYFPMNKSLWTSSYVLTTTGLALLALGCCYWLIDIKGYKRWAKPFVIFGVNALPLFVFSGIMARMLGAYRVTGPGGQPVSLQKWIFDNIYLSIAQPIDASLLYAVIFILLWLFLMWL
ncbi:MAG: DUF5009 domain-containing protein, partial [Chloracidobacterium sp.]|nr:DUF5009 domain-containing protein [Chloracidobacterium sp.]